MLAGEKEEEGNLGDVEMGRGHLVVVGKGGRGKGNWRGREWGQDPEGGSAH